MFNPGFEYSNQFPVQDFRDNSLGSMLGSFMQAAPQTRNYFDFLGQGAPQYEDYKPSFGRALLSGLAGGIAGMKNPMQGIDVAQSISSQPYMQALDQYMMRKQGLGEASKAEMGMLGLARQFGQDQTSQNQFSQNLGFQNRKLDTDVTLQREANNLKLQEMQRQNNSPSRSKLLTTLQQY